MMGNDLVSIIMPCYNQGKYIDEAIQSVLRSTYANIEIIVVNDGSTDPFTNELLKTKSWNKTTVLNVSNIGVCEARNHAIRNSIGKYILPLDADDKIAPLYIEEAVAVLETRPEVKVVSCDVEMFGYKKGPYALPQHSMEMLLGQNTMVVTSMFRRVDFDATIGYNPNMSTGFEDWDFWLTLLENGGGVYKIDKVGFYYRIKKGSRNKSIKKGILQELRYQVYLNHKELYAKNFFNPVNSIEYQLIEKSKEYQVGRIILKPIRIIQNILRQLL